MILAVSLAAAGCGGSTATPSVGAPTIGAPTAMPTGTPAAAPTAAPTTAPTTAPTPTASPTVAAVPAHWATSGSLLQSHASTHVLLVSGGKVLIVGDDNLFAPGPPSAMEAEIWDPGTSTWTATGSLNAPRDSFVAQTLGNGHAFVTGGLNDGYLAYSSTKLYDPAAGTWTSTGLMATARTNLASALLHDGRVMAIGGEYRDDTTDTVLASVEIYEPGTGKWSAASPLHAPRRDAQAVTLADGSVLVVGGDDGTNTLASGEIWDPGTGKWTVVGSLATARTEFTLVALPGGSALVAGGLDPTTSPTVAVASAERFDRATNKWKSAGTMKSAGASRISAVLANGTVLIAGGRIGAWKPAISAAEIYDPAAGTWTATIAMPMTLERSGAVVLGDGSVLVAGGDGGFTGPGSAPWYPDQRLQAIRYFPATP